MYFMRIDMNHTPDRPDRRFCVAPMMERTDRHCRYLMRLLTKRAMLYTEMVVDKALLHGDAARFLGRDEFERPLGFQLGGCDPDALAQCAVTVEQAGYDEVNLNVGCPSERVQSGRMGACLMKSPELVAECVAAMRERVGIPVTVKCRTGVDDCDSYAELARFIETVGDRGGCEVFIVHARKAVSGLSTRSNLRVPPLQYDTVRRLKKDFPGRQFILNGGLRSIAAAEEAMIGVDGVMLGRAAYDDMWLLHDVDAAFYGDAPVNDKAEVLRHYLKYILRESDKYPLIRLIRPLVGLIRGLPSATSLRRDLFALDRAADAPGWFERLIDTVAAPAG